ncbi:hypothetical protein [Nitrosomonas ureae]|uniref:Uncharacterized protein n=1 Tax=Nitrosomonas ureae TaxID=44577 RepID=A0A1H9G7K8_9PROT|nr:hypothetical protein [Nitrosomonas ureae]SEQ46126.1 hypothetical protein SAMN05421510_10572 [Nitrosomonas ureae]
MSQHITSISSVCFNIEKSNPPQLTLHAIGKVNSSGWRSPSLFQRVYVVQPEDGIQDFEFYAEPPNDMALWVISPISSETTIFLENWMKGIRINSATNSVVAHLSDIACSVARGSPSSHVLKDNNLELNYFKLPHDGVGGQDSPPDNPPPVPTGTQGH